MREPKHPGAPVRFKPSPGAWSSLQLLRMMLAGQWWHTPLIPALGRQRQEDLCEFEANLVCESRFQDRLQSYRETLSRKTKKQTNKQTKHKQKKRKKKKKE